MSVRRLLIVSVSLACLVSAVPAGAPPKRYRVGLSRSFFPHVRPEVFLRLAVPFRKLLHDRTGFGGDLHLDNAEALAEQLEADQTQLAVLAGYEFAWARERYPDLRPLVLILGRERRPTAVVVVKRDSPAKGLDDLKASPPVLSRDAKERCRLFAQRRFLQHGPGKLPVEPACGADALDEVIDGKIPATVVDGGTLKEYRELKPHRAEWLRTIYQTETFPPSVIVYRQAGLDEATVRQFRQALTGAKHAQQYRDLLRLWRLSSFEPIPADYDQQLARSLTEYPPPAGFGRADRGTQRPKK